MSDPSSAPAAAGTRLWCARLALADFRNHAATELALDARPVCLFGPNGAGKTNLLEALTMLSPGRGLRGAAAPDLACVRGDPERTRLWSVAATLSGEGGLCALGAAFDRTPDGVGKRIARIDGRPASAGELSQAARMLWVTPAMDRLFAGPPGDRRRFFDRMAMARAPGHGVAAAAYERAQRERQRLIADAIGEEAWVSGLEAAMAEHGATLALNRAQTLAHLQTVILARPDGAFPKSILAFDGPLETACLEGLSREAAMERLRRALRDSRPRDAAAGRALVGPHRSDLLVRHAAKDMPAAQCSTGEQKALLLGLLLAQAEALSSDPAGGPALILIDEAAAHLDADRRAALYEALLALPGQAWLTGTDEGLFEALGGRGQRFEVRDGVTRRA